MGDVNKQICRLCLDITPPCECETIDERKKEILEGLLINIDYDISTDVVACNKCLERLQDFHDFKSHYMSEFVRQMNEEKCLENSQICRLCLSAIEDDTLKYTTTPDVKYEVSLEEIIGICLPEADFDTIGDHLICKPCQCRVKNYYEFMRNCGEVEQRIHKYCQVQGHGTAGIIILEDMLKFEDYEALHDERTIVKMECLEPENMNATVKDEENNIQFEEVYVKEEKLDNGPEPKVVDYDCCGKNESSKQKPIVTSSNGRKKPTFFCSKCPYSSSVRSLLGTHMRTHSDNGVHSCTLCSFVTDSKLSLKTHTSSHRGSTKAFGCRDCLFETNSKYSLQLHILRHKGKLEVEMHMCPSCPYKTVCKPRLVKHRKRVHEEDIQMFKCKECLFSTKHRNSLVGHQMTHLKFKESPTYNCETCKFETKCITDLVKHMVIHTYPELVNSFKCEKCRYQGMSQLDVAEHMEIFHSGKDPYSCDECSYSSKLKNNLIRHKTVHQKDGERKIFKCQLCSYQAKHNASVKEHMLKVHTDSSVMPKVKCTQCPFETIAKELLSRHMARRHGPTLKCPQCVYVTTQKKDMQTHLLVHQEATIQCDRCDFQTRYKFNMRNHMAQHDPSLKSFKCDKCKFCTTNRSTLKSHQITHMELGETTAYKCATCDFQTKYKHSLRGHTKQCLKKKK